MDENKPQQTNKNDTEKIIHTYSSDMADAVRMNDASVIKIALAEKKKQEREAFYKESQGTKFSKILLLLGGIVLIIGASVGLYFLSHRNNLANTSNISNMGDTSLIAYDSKSEVDISSAQNANDTASAISPVIQKSGAPGSINEILLTHLVDGSKQQLSSNNFFSLLNISASQALINTIGSYMIGTYTPPASVGQGSHLFIIFQVNNYDQAYASMLTWEPTILNDLYKIFNIDVTGDRSALLSKPWKDITINNRDARILYDVAGNDVLYYIFVNKNDLLITDSKDAINEIFLRIIARNNKPL